MNGPSTRSSTSYFVVVEGVNDIYDEWGNERPDGRLDDEYRFDWIILPYLTHGGYAVVSGDDLMPNLDEHGEHTYRADWGPKGRIGRDYSRVDSSYAFFASTYAL